MTGRGGPDVERVCFILRVRRDRLDEYKQRHREVWPQMLDALRETGWTNYSLFLSEDGLLVGYLETEDFSKSTRNCIPNLSLNRATISFNNEILGKGLQPA